MFRHCLSNPPAARSGINHEAGIRNVTAAAGAVRAQGVGADDFATLLGYIGSGITAKPIGERILARDARIDRISIARRDHIVENLPDGLAIGIRGWPDVQHGLNVQRRTFNSQLWRAPRGRSPHSGTLRACLFSSRDDRQGQARWIPRPMQNFEILLVEVGQEKWKIAARDPQLNFVARRKRVIGAEQRETNYVRLAKTCAGVFECASRNKMDRSIR